MKKQCANCRRPAVRDSRFCFMCKDDVRYEMESSRYLTHIPTSPLRLPGSSEKRRETHDGVDE